MKRQQEIRSTLVVMAFGLFAFITTVYVLNRTHRSANVMVDISALQFHLNGLERYARTTSLHDLDPAVLREYASGIQDAAAEIEENHLFPSITKFASKLYAGLDQLGSSLLQSPRARDSDTSIGRSASGETKAFEHLLTDISELDYLLSAAKQEYEARLKTPLNVILPAVLILASFAAFAFAQRRTLSQFSEFKRAVDEKARNEAARVETIDRFLEAIAKGEYSANISYQTGDVLLDRLNDARQKLQLGAEVDRKRNWTTQGMAEIGMILRDTSSITELYSRIVIFCVKYTQSNQGSLFVLNQSDEHKPYLELVSTYAYDRKKFLQKRVELGEGLLGQAFLEAQTVRMTNLPPDYIHITSGLGDAAPRALVIVPLKLNDKVYGLIEMASFRPYEDFEIRFLESLAESVASSISSARINDQTKQLLQISQEQMEELRAQEEEVRQNMEELSATQEQMARQMEESRRLAEDLQIRENVFALTTILSESDLFGTIVLANDKLVEVSKYSREELIGKPHSIFRHPDMPKELFRLLWTTIKQGKVFRGVIKNRAKDGSHYWVDATIVPVKDQSGKTVKYIGARYHITNDEFAEYLYNSQASRLGLPALGLTNRAA